MPGVSRFMTNPGLAVFSYAPSGGLASLAGPLAGLRPETVDNPLHLSYIFKDEYIFSIKNEWRKDE